jgi:signal transduction histidine kinase
MDMSAVANLEQIRPAFITRLSHSLAQNPEIREVFRTQIDRFYNLLERAVETGQFSCLDPILIEWIHAQPQSRTVDPNGSISSIVVAMMLQTLEASYELLARDQAYELVRAALPVYFYAVDFAARCEVQRLSEKIADDLNRANTALQRLDESKSGFISVAAHELRTPLTLIEGYTSMMKENLPEDIRDSAEAYIQGIHTGIQRLREIINNMLDVSLIDNQLLAINFQPVWFDRLFAIVQRDLKDLLQERRLSIEIDPFPGWDVMTYGDGERLLQTFRNLITNAVKYTPDGGRINVGGRLLPGFIEITVSDSGIGIPLSDQQRIFDKFGRLGSDSLYTTSKTQFKGGGPGLGLPIAKGIIEAHGGTIWVESPGYDEVECPGSIFHVLLPLLNEPPDEQGLKLIDSSGEVKSLFSFRKYQAG